VIIDTTGLREQQVGTGGRVHAIGKDVSERVATGNER
jgi:hypothetical protein